MQHLAEDLLVERIREIQRDAEADRRASLASGLKDGPAAWRRAGGAAARRLSWVLEDVAIRLDPAIRRPSYGRE